MRLNNGVIEYYEVLFMMTPPGLQIQLQCRVTLTFDPKVGHFIPLPRGPVELICSKTYSFS